MVTIYHIHILYSQISPYLSESSNITIHIYTCVYIYIHMYVYIHICIYSVSNHPIVTIPPSVATPLRCTSPAPRCCQRRSFRNPWPPTSPGCAQIEHPGIQEEQQMLVWSPLMILIDTDDEDDDDDDDFVCATNRLNLGCTQSWFPAMMIYDDTVSGKWWPVSLVCYSEAHVITIFQTAAALMESSIQGPRVSKNQKSDWQSHSPSIICTHESPG